MEALGNALFNPFVLEYAPQPDRIRNIIARLQKVPLYLDQASSNLASAPRIWTQVAIEENQGNIELVDKTIRAAVPGELSESYARAARPALDAMTNSRQFLKGSLSDRDHPTGAWGRTATPANSATPWRAASKPTTRCNRPNAILPLVRKRMLELALPLHRQWEPQHGDHGDLSGEALENRVIGEVLAKIADRHSTPRLLHGRCPQRPGRGPRFRAGKASAARCPPRANLQVIPTPEFMRGIYAVGGFNPAPALEPQLGAFYWVTPIPPDWPKERVESKLREYNFYKLKLLTIHEAMPGHYVQMEYRQRRAADSPPPAPLRLRQRPVY